MLDMSVYKVRMLLNNSLTNDSKTFDLDGLSVDDIDDLGYVEFGKGIYESIAALTNGDYDQILSLMLVLIDREEKSILGEYKTGDAGHIVELVDEWQTRFDAVLMDEG